MAATLITWLLLLPSMAAALTFTVNTSQDSPDPCHCIDGTAGCSVRGAIVASNQAGGANIINGLSGQYLFDGSTGDVMTVTSNVTINGPSGPVATHSSGNTPVAGMAKFVIDKKLTQLFTIAAGGSLTLNNIAIEDNGRDLSLVSLQGGCIRNDGTLTLSNVYMVNCNNRQASGCLPSTNGASVPNGCRPSEGGPIHPGAGQGGAVYNTGTLNMINGSESYHSHSNIGADIFNAEGASFNFTDSELNGGITLGGDSGPVACVGGLAYPYCGGKLGNGDTGGGGGCLYNEGTVSGTRCTFNFCRSYFGIGGGAILNGMDSGPGCPLDGQQDAVCRMGGTVTLTNCTLTDNRARRTEGGAFKTMGPKLCTGLHTPQQCCTGLHTGTCGTMNTFFTTIAHSQSGVLSAIVLKAGAVWNHFATVVGFHHIESGTYYKDTTTISPFQLCCDHDDNGAASVGGHSNCDGTINALGLSMSEQCLTSECNSPFFGCPTFQPIDGLQNLCFGPNQINAPSGCNLTTGAGCPNPYWLDTSEIINPCNDAANPAVGAAGACSLATDERGVPRPSGACDLGAFQTQ